MRRDVTDGHSRARGFFLAERRLLVLLLVAAGWPHLVPAKAQALPSPPSYVHRAWSIEEGLPQNSIFAIEQTRDGYLWIGTLQGLVRFDGHRFLVFQVEETPGLASDRIYGLHETPDGALWMATSKGLSRYADGQFRTFTVADGLPSNIVHLLVEDEENGFWISTDRGLAHYRDGHFSTLSTANGLPSDGILALLKDTAGELWVGTQAGLAHGQDETWTVYTTADGLASDAVTELYQRADGSIWAGTEDGVSRFDPATGHFQTYPVQGTPFAFLEDRTGTFWVGGRGHGLLRFEEDAFLRQQLPGDPIGPDIVFLMEDREGVLWIGTNGGGLHQITPASISALLQAPPGRPGPMIHDLIERDNGEIWATSYAHGVFRRRRDGREQQYGKAEGLPTFATWSLAETPDGTLWVGTSHGLVRFEDERFSPVEAPGLAFSAGRVTSLLVDRQGHLLIGTGWAGGGLSRLTARRNPQGSSSEGVQAYDVEVVLSGTDLEGGGGILALVESDDGTVWIGTETSGLGRLRDGDFRSYTATLGTYPIRMIAEQPDGSLWLGTYGNGLCRFDPLAEQTRCLSKAHGLPDNTVHAILDDQLGYVWLSSNAGLFRLQRSELEAFFQDAVAEVHADHFTNADGMPSTECNGGFQSPGWVTSDGRLLLPTTNGIAVVDPAGVQETQRDVLPMQIEAIVTNDQVMPPTPGVVLPAGNDRLVFRYTAFHFRAPEKLRFRYRLDGQDHEGMWIEAGTERTATYTNLAPGTYTFRVQGTLGNGRWNEVDLPVQLAPFFYQTMWFRALALLLFLGFMGTGVWAFSRRRYRRALARLHLQRALEHERNRISRDMHDEVGASLTEIAILSELAQRQGDNGHTPHGHLEKIADTSRAMLDALGEIIWAINPENDRLAPMVAYLREYAARYLEATPLNVQLRFPMEVPPLDVSAEFRRNVFLVLKEALHNLVKHAHATQAQVELTLQDDLHLVIQDDGLGFTEERPDGRGLKNMRHRANEIGGTLTIQATRDTGTRIALRAPLRQTVPHITQ